VPEDYVTGLLDSIFTEEPLVAVRILWFLEKLCNIDGMNHYFENDKDPRLVQTLQNLIKTDKNYKMKLLSLSFPLKYQGLKTILAYVRKIDLR
jgi:hypothetical protein